MKLSQINEAKYNMFLGGRQDDPSAYKIIDIPVILYHGTSSKSSEEFKTNGFQAGVHFTPTRSYGNFSALRAVRRWGGDPIVFVISTENLPDDVIAQGIKDELQFDIDLDPSVIQKIYVTKAKLNQSQVDGWERSNVNSPGEKHPYLNETSDIRQSDRLDSNSTLEVKLCHI